MKNLNKYYAIVRLAPQVPAWCDPSNNIFLNSANRNHAYITKDTCLKQVEKGVKAGLLILEELKIVEKPVEKPIIEAKEVTKEIAVMKEVIETEEKKEVKEIKEVKKEIKKSKSKKAVKPLEEEI